MPNIKNLLSLVVFIITVLAPISSRADLSVESQVKFGRMMVEYFGREWVDPVDPVARIRVWILGRITQADVDHSARIELATFLFSEGFRTTVSQMVQRRRENARTIINTDLIDVIRGHTLYSYPYIGARERAIVIVGDLLIHLQSLPSINNIFNPIDFLNFLRSEEGLALITSLLRSTPLDLAAPTDMSQQSAGRIRSEVSARKNPQNRPVIIFSRSTGSSGSPVESDPNLCKSMERAAELKRQRDVLNEGGPSRLDLWEYHTETSANWKRIRGQQSKEDLERRATQQNAN